MGDMYCRNPQCQEPWSVYAVQREFSPEERTWFLAGQGCPCCNLGRPKNLLAMQVWNRALERIAGQLQGEENAVWDSPELHVINPHRHTLLHAVRASLLESCQELSVKMSKQQEYDELLHLIDQAIETDDARALSGLRQQMLRLIQHMTGGEAASTAVSPEQDTLAYQQFLRGLQEWE